MIVNITDTCNIGEKQFHEKKFFKKGKPHTVPAPWPHRVLFWSFVAVKGSTAQVWVWFVFSNLYYEGSIVVWGFRGRAQTLPYCFPPKNPTRLLLAPELHSGIQLSGLQLDPAVRRALPFWQVVCFGDLLPPMTPGWDAGSAAEGWEQQTFICHGWDGEDCDAAWIFL